MAHTPKPASASPLFELVGRCSFKGEGGEKPPSITPKTRLSPLTDLVGRCSFKGEGGEKPPSITPKARHYPLADLAGRCSFKIEQEKTPSIIQKAMAELVGTYILIFVGCGSLFVEDMTLVGIAITWGAVVMALVCSLGHISGAHFNPAVTFALAAIGRFPWKQVPLYTVVQVLGSLAASLSLHWAFGGGRAAVMVTRPGAAGEANVLIPVVFEIVISFMLMFVVCGATDHRAAKELAGVVIGAIVFSNAIVSGKVSGCSMNPARSLGPAIVTRDFHKIWIYLVSPMIGAVMGSMSYQLFQLPVKRTCKDPESQS